MAQPWTVSPKPWASSSTPTSLDNHAVVILEHYRLILIQVEHRDGTELGGDAARLGNGAGVDAVDQGLDDGVVGGVGIVWEGEAALARAEERVVAGGSNNPVAPAHRLEVHVHGRTAATVPTAALLAPVDEKQIKIGAGFQKKYDLETL